MSFMDRLTGGDQIATSNVNGRFRAVSVTVQRDYSAEEDMAWSMLRLAVEDTAILARYGLYNSKGECQPWPMSKGQYMTIACMNDPRTHIALKWFWHDKTQAQLWCDLIGCNLPARQIWAAIIKQHAR